MMKPRASRASLIREWITLMPLHAEPPRVTQSRLAYRACAMVGLPSQACAPLIAGLFQFPEPRRRGVFLYSVIRRARDEQHMTIHGLSRLSPTCAGSIALDFSKRILVKHLKH